MKVKAKALTLIEVCIAFGILAVCFAAIFSNFHIASKLIAKTQKVQLESTKRQYFLQRLQVVFEHVLIDSIQLEDEVEKEHPYPRLTFTYKNGLDKERIFSGIRKAEICLNEENQLILETFSKDEEVSRKEILLENISDLKWDLDTQAAIRLEVSDMQGKKTPYAFLLPRSPEGIIRIEASL